MFSCPKSALGLDSTLNSSAVISDLADASRVAQTASEMCDAVSLSLGLGSEQDRNHQLYGSTAPSEVGSLSHGNSFFGTSLSEFGGKAKMTLELTSQPSFDYFGTLIEECRDLEQSSCVDRLKFNARDSNRKMTYGPEQSRNVCEESYVPMNALVDKSTAPFQPDLAYKPSNYRNSTNPLLCDNTLCFNDLRNSSQITEPGPEGSNGPWYAAFCDYIQSSSLGSLRHCKPLSDADGSGITEARGTADADNEHMESSSAMMHPRSMYTKPCSIKTEQQAWVDVTNSNLRFEGVFPGMRVFLSEKRVCQVCGDVASGCHYGAVTCGSCKVFFKRAAEGKQNHLCASRNDCNIDKLRRKNCASCRLRRCFLAGMSLKGQRLKGLSQPRIKLEGEQSAGEERRKRKKAGEQDGVPDSNATATQAQSSISVLGPLPNMQYHLPLLSVLLTIEPDMIHAGHDPAQPDCPSSLLSSLNELGERQLVSVVRWAKAIPGFRDLHVEDQMCVIQSSWMSVMVLGLSWRSYTQTDASMLYFAPDLVFNDQRMRASSMYDHCVQMCLMSQMFGVLRVTKEEFLCMKALLLFSVLPVEGLKNQHGFDQLRTSYIQELERLTSQRGETTRTQRLFHLTQLLDYLQPIVRKLHQFTYDLYIQVQSQPMRVSFPEMIAELVSMHVPKVLTGLVKPILFHKAL
ncbi:progesterone receptor-like [Osmerus mordax]|uniref:progesterone receptor-like n=1 Tax=Osmerus mordax TaxID=8014 RepID=UPI00350F42E4